MEAIFSPTRFSLVRISVRDLVADGKSLLRNSGVGGGGENLSLMIDHKPKPSQYPRHAKTFLSAEISILNGRSQAKTW